MGTAANFVVGGATVTIGSDLGYIKGGAKVTPSVNLFLAGEEIEQLTLPEKAWRVSENIEISFTLAEPTAANIKLAEDIDNTITTGTPPTPDTLDWADNQFSTQERVLAITGVVPGTGGFTRTITADAAVLSGPAEIAFTKGALTELACTFTCLYNATNSRALQLSDATA